MLNLKVRRGLVVSINGSNFRREAERDFWTGSRGAVTGAPFPVT